MSITSITHPFGINRAQELENILGDLLDKFDTGLLFSSSTDEESDLSDLMDLARRTLDRDETPVEV